MKQRPAETGAVAGAIALLIGRVAGITDADTLTAIGIIIGFIPAAVTWIVVTLRKPRMKRITDGGSNDAPV